MSKAASADRLILRGAISTAAGFLVRFGARFLFLFVAGRFFGAALFGAFSLAVAVVEASIGLGGLAMKKMLFQMLDRHEEQSGSPAFHVVIDALLLVFLTSSAIAAVIMGLAVLLPVSVLTPATGTALFWLAPMIAGQAMLDVLLAATRWKHAIRYEVIGRSLVEPYSLLAGALAAWQLGFEAHGLIIAYWVGTMAASLYALWGAKRCFGRFGLSSYRPRADRLWAIFRSLLPNTGTDLIAGIYARLDLYLVGILLGERWAGIYSMAQQIRTPIRHVRQSFDGLLIPVVTKTLAAKGAAATREALATASRFILAVQLPFLIGLVAIGLPLLELFGPGFHAGYLALVLLAAAEVIHGAFGLGDLLFAYLKPRLGLWITAASILFGIVSAFLLIHLWGINGAALSVLLTYGLQAWLRRRVLRSHLGVSVPIGQSAAPLLAGAAGLALVLLVVDQADRQFDAWAIFTLLAGFAAYGAALAGWLLATRQSLSIRGFQAEAAADPKS